VAVCCMSACPLGKERLALHRRGVSCRQGRACPASRLCCGLQNDSLEHAATVGRRPCIPLALHVSAERVWHAARLTAFAPMSAPHSRLARTLQVVLPRLKGRLESVSGLHPSSLLILLLALLALKPGLMGASHVAVCRALALPPNCGWL
jgi:hypothetical protein